MQPRRHQSSITIRSARATELLKRHVRPGRSQAQVIEMALERLPLPTIDPLDPAERAARMERVDAILGGLAPGCLPTVAEFDALEYDEDGQPR